MALKNRYRSRTRSSKTSKRTKKNYRIRTRSLKKQRKCSKSKGKKSVIKKRKYGGSTAELDLSMFKRGDSYSFDPSVLKTENDETPLNPELKGIFEDTVEGTEVLRKIVPKISIIVLIKKFKIEGKQEKFKFKFLPQHIKTHKDVYDVLKRCTELIRLGGGSYGEVYQLGTSNYVIKLSDKKNYDEAESIRTVNNYEEGTDFEECGEKKPDVTPLNTECCDKTTNKIKLGEQPLSNGFCKNGRYFPRIFFNGKVEVEEEAKQEVNHRYFIIMEIVGEKTLDKFIEENELTLTIVLDIFKQICEAVNILHKNKIFHGDLKGDNIRIGKNNQVYIIDLQCSYENAYDNSSCKIIGTPLYMAPYKASGCIGFDGENKIKCQYRSDIWSMGVILYNILTGKFLSNAENIMSILWKIGDAMKNNLALVQQNDYGKLYNNVLKIEDDITLTLESTQTSKLINLLQKLFDYKEEEKPFKDEAIVKTLFDGFDTVDEILKYLKENFNDDLTLKIV